MSAKLITRQVGDVTVIDAVGRITLGEGSSVFRETIKDLVSKGNKKVLLNLAEVSYIDSSGIGELVSGFTSVSNAGGQPEAPETDEAHSGSASNHEAVYRF